VGWLWEVGVCGFLLSSVQAAEQIPVMGLKFIGVVKTATRKFPMHALDSVEVKTRGERHTCVNKTADGRVRMKAMVWLDRERRYFISTASSAAEVSPYTRRRWRQLEAGLEKVEIVVPQPAVTELYYSCCTKIDQHNRCRQADLEIEKVFQVKERGFRVSFSLLAMIIVDSWMVCRGEPRTLPKRILHTSCK
jgi:Transposase IS4